MPTTSGVGPQDSDSTPIRKGWVRLAGPAPLRSSPLLTRSTTRAMDHALLPQQTLCLSPPTKCPLHSPKPPCVRPNAGAHLLPEAAARNERRLEAVSCTPWLGAGEEKDIVLTRLLPGLGASRCLGPRTSGTVSIGGLGAPCPCFPGPCSSSASTPS